MTYENKIEQLKTNPKYKDLSQVKDNNQVVRNIRKELKKSFPLVKFSVRRTSQYNININWLDGITVKEVEKITSKYEHGHFDGMEDIYIRNQTIFNKVFGGINFIYCQRKYSDKLIEKAINKLEDEHEYLRNEEITVTKFKDGSLCNIPIKGTPPNELRETVQSEMLHILSELEY